MAKLRNNYEKTGWARYVTWMNGGSNPLEENMFASLEEKA